MASFLSSVTSRLNCSFVAGYVTHTTDRYPWTVRIPNLTPPQKEKVLQLLDAVDREVGILEHESASGWPLNQAFTLRADQSIRWSEDKRYERALRHLEDLFRRRFGKLCAERDSLCWRCKLDAVALLARPREAVRRGPIHKEKGT